jgi:protein-disulfide isomerase
VDLEGAMSKRTALIGTLDVVATLAVVTVAAIVIFGYSRHQEPRVATNERAITVPSLRIPVSATPALGSSAAPVAVVEFSDFECKYCSEFARVGHVQIEKEYVNAGKVLFSFRHYPNDKIHRNAVPVAKAAHCAALAGRFWDMYRLLFESPAKVSEGAAATAAGEVGVDAEGLSRCVNARETESAIQADIALGKRLGVRGTPWFFVGTLRNGEVTPMYTLAGSRPVSEFTAAIEALLVANANRTDASSGAIVVESGLKSALPGTRDGPAVTTR